MQLSTILTTTIRALEKGSYRAINIIITAIRWQFHLLTVEFRKTLRKTIQV